MCFIFSCRKTKIKDMQTTDISVHTASVEVSILECKQQWNQVLKVCVNHKTIIFEEMHSTIFIFIFFSLAV